MADKFLLCVAHRHGMEWEAICLDLDIAVQGRSFEEVQNGLNEAVSSYIEDALKEPEPTRSQLLSRRAPLFVRIAWLWRFIIPAIFDRKDDRGSTVGFPVASCHA